MKMKALIFSLALIPAPAFALGDAPFCIYSNDGLQQCYYYSIDACQQAVRSLGGMCAPNNQPQKQLTPIIAPQPIQQMQQPDIVGAMRRGYEFGVQQRMEKESSISQPIPQYPAATQATQLPSNEIDMADYSSAGLAEKCSAYIATRNATPYAEPMSQAIASGYCMGYIHGYLGGRSMPDSSGVPKACPPPTANTDDFARTIEQGLQRSPAAASSPQLALVAGALAGAYPCK